MKKYRVASLFSGCGGADLGVSGGFTFLGDNYERLPVSIVFANDMDVFAAETYSANFAHPFLRSSIEDVTSEKIPEHEILIGGFPCQAFSIVGQRHGLNDKRGQLFQEMARILHDKQPKAFIAENVKGLTNLQNGKIFRLILEEFEQAGYNLHFKVLNAANYGIPQKRERIFIVGFRNDLDVSFRFPLPFSGLIPLKAVLQETFDKKFIFSQRAVEGMKKSNKAFNKGRVQNPELPSNTVSSHLAKISLNGTDPVLLIDAENEIYRRFTPREAARIQSFPDNFIFPCSEFQNYKQIGNAIPPVLMWRLAKEVIHSLENASSVKQESRLNGGAFNDQLPLFALFGSPAVSGTNITG